MWLSQSTEWQAAATPESAQLWNNIGMCLFGKGKHVAVSAPHNIRILSLTTYLCSSNYVVLHMHFHVTINSFSGYIDALSLSL